MYKALAIESKDGSSGTRCSQAGTKLNVCAILSSQKKHQDAVMFAKSAISDYETLLTDVQIGLVEACASAQTQFEELDLATLLLSASIAYYNLGAEHEHCREFRSAHSAFETSLKYAMKAPPEVASQMIKEASRSLKEVQDKKEKA